MKRTAGVCVLVAALGGCMSTDRGPQTACGGGPGGGYLASVPGVQGPWGQPIAATGAYPAPTPEARAAQALIAQGAPMDLINPQAAMAARQGGIMQASAMMAAGGPSGIMLASGACKGGNCGPMGPMMNADPSMLNCPPGGGMANAARFAAQRTSVRFVSPAGMKVSWYTGGGDARMGFASNQLSVPDHYNFLQAAVYRLKLGNIPNHAGMELYPTLEVVPANGKTNTFLAHSAVPVAFTDEDFDQVASGNYVVKVIYLPDPQFQDLATTGPDEVVSTRLEPGVNPIAEARRRGSILLVVRLGNINLEAPNTPPMDAPGGTMNHGAMPQGMMGPMGPAMQQGGLISHPGMPTAPLMLPPSAPASTGTPAPTTDIPVSKAPATSPYQQVKYEAPAADSACPTCPGGKNCKTDGKPLWEKNWWSDDKK